MDKLTFAIHGMGCEGCVAVIENAVLPMAGVAYVGVSLVSGTMTIRPGPGFDTSVLVAKMTALGYGVGELPGLISSSGCQCRRFSA